MDPLARLDQKPLTHFTHAFVNLSQSTSANAAATAFLGLSADEPRVTGIDELLLAGSWLEPGELDACIIPLKIAQALGISLDQVGQARIETFGRQFLVKGIIDDQLMDRLNDLDGEPLAPVDFGKRGTSSSSGCVALFGKTWGAASGSPSVK